MVCCCAVNCCNRPKNGVRLFIFPKDKGRRDVWIAKVKRDKWIPTPSSRLCEVVVSSSLFVRR